MRLLLVAVLLAAWLTSPLVWAAPALAADCQFVLGFKTLHDLIPETVGDCVENEHHNPANGDALQRTTKGLLVWRKADNWTAFTDGFRTWINGPNGLQQRLNTDRFPWERDPVSSSCVLPTTAVTFDQFVPAEGGAVVVKGTASNPCDATIHLMIDVVAQDRQDGQPVADGPTLFVVNLPPGGTRPVSVRVPAATQARWYAWRVSPVYESAGSNFCVDVGTTRCLRVDPWLASTIEVLRGIEEGNWLLRVAAEHGVTIQRGTTEIGVLGYYRRTTKTIVLDSRLDAYSSWVRASILAHELQHAADDAAGRFPKTTAECFRSEEQAFIREARIWVHFWENHLAPETDALHIQLNDVAATAARDPVGFAQSLVPKYHDQCDAYSSPR